MFRRKRKEPQGEGNGLSREQALACRPVKCPIVEEEELSDDLVRLCYPLNYRPWFGRLAERLGLWDGSPRRKKLELDAMGTTAWRLMDGRRSVAQIVDAFAAHYELQPREAELSVAAFIKTLGSRGLVALHQVPQREQRTQSSSAPLRGKKSGKRHPHGP